MTAESAKQPDGRFLHSILTLLIVAALASGGVAAISLAKTQVPGQTTVVSQP